MENTPLIYGKMIEVMGKVPAIGKEQRNTQQGFNFRGIDQVMNALQNILPQVGVFYLPEVLESTREVRETKNGGKNTFTTLKVKYTFYAEDGSNVSAIVQSEGMDSADKSSNKAMSGACKYALFQAFNIATEEFKDQDADDPDTYGTEAAAPSSVKPAPKADDEDTFLNKFPGVPENMIIPIHPNHAEKIEDSEGVPYGMIPTMELRFRLNSLVKSIRNNGLTQEDKEQKMSKLGVINAILLDRKAHPEKRGTYKPAE